MPDWVYITNDETGGTTRVADEPGVVEHYEARGWRKVDPPDAGIFVPRSAEHPADTDAYGVAWVTLQHVETGALHRFPADAADGLRDNGWYPVLEAKPEPQISKPEPATVDTDDVSIEAADK